MAESGPTRPPACVLAGFDLGGDIVDAVRHGRGLINDTWLLATDTPGAPRVILQRINPVAFPRPREVMDNLQQMLTHVSTRLAAGRGRDRDLQFPRLYPSRDGELLVIDEHGDAWRAMTFIEDTVSVHRPRHAGQAHAAGCALGRFHDLVSDLAIDRLHDTRPDFHNTPRHLLRLADALESAADELMQADGVGECLDFIDARRDSAGNLEMAISIGRIRRQIIHGDPKLDNVLLDRSGQRAVSLIDLDTVKPGIVHHDIADCLRSCCNLAGETPTDSGGQVVYDLDYCRAALEGWYRESGPAASGIAVDDLVAAIRLIPFELGVRFLTDHLNGNRYFRTEYPLQNLHRAMTQFRLVADIEDKQARIGDIIDTLQP